MRIGLDFRALQVGHQFRGIGQVIREATRQLDARLPMSDRFVRFTDPRDASVDQVVAGLGELDHEVDGVDLPLPRFGRLERLRGGLSREQNPIVARSCDVLVQFDASMGVSAETPTILFVYDQIPLLLGDRYPLTYRPTYRAARQSGQSMTTSLRKALERVGYERRLSDALRKAERVVAISEHTASTTTDFAGRMGLRRVADKIVVARLGHDLDAADSTSLNALERTRIDALGLSEHQFVFFMGGGDERRRVDLLVAAFNDLRARGRDLRLVLAGYDFQVAEEVVTDSARHALMESSYRHDIHLMGFVSEAERAWLYRHAAAFVFPSEHEGFGLPVVEAVAAGCTVVTFDNTSISELRGPNCYLCQADWEALSSTIVEVLERSPATRATHAAAGAEWAASFTWDDLGRTLADALEQIRSERTSMT